MCYRSAVLFPSGCRTNHSRIRPNIYFQKQLCMFERSFDWTPGGHVVDRCLDDLMFEVMLILDGVPVPLNQLPLPHISCLSLPAWRRGGQRTSFISSVCFGSALDRSPLTCSILDRQMSVCVRVHAPQSWMAWLKWAMIVLKDGYLTGHTCVCLSSASSRHLIADLLHAHYNATCCRARVRNN